MSDSILFVSEGEYGDIYGATLAESIKAIKPAASIKCVKNSQADEALGAADFDCVIFADQLKLDVNNIKKAKHKKAKVLIYASANSNTLKTSVLKKLSKVIDLALASFPLEVAMYKDAGIDALLVGHPLVDIMPPRMSRDEARAALGYDRTEAPVILLPGSNPDKDKLEKFLKSIVKAAAEAAEISMLKVKLVIPDAEKYDKDFLTSLVKISPRRLRTFEGQRHTALMAASGAVIIAGEMTIEATLAGAHMVIFQKTSVISHLLSRLKGERGSIGLPNIILNKALCPELVQKDINYKKIIEGIMELLEGANREEFDRDLTRARKQLGEPETIKRAAKAVCGVLGE